MCNDTAAPRRSVPRAQPAPPGELSTRAFRRGDYACALGAALLALALYVRTLAPTLTGEDSGELIGAAHVLGIPHPPGYPLWTMLAHLFTYLPHGSIAWRVNFTSAFFAAAAAGLVVLLVIHLSKNRLAGVFAALALACSFEFWEQALIAEVYTLNAFLLALCTLLLWRWRGGTLHGAGNAARSDRLLYGFALVYGISLANHNTMHLLGPWFAVFILHADGWRPRRLPVYALLMLIAFSAAFLLYTYLPLRSMSNPPVDWGNPETLKNWWRMVSREQFAFMMGQYPRDVERFLGQMLAMGRMWLHEFSPWVTVAGLVGLLMLSIRRRFDGLWLIAGALLVVLGFVLAQNPHLDREWLWVMSVFGIPAYLITAVGLGYALAWCGRHAGQGAMILAGAACVLSPLLLHARANDMSGYYWAEDYARNLLRPLPPEAVFFGTADHAVFGVLYLQVVEGKRPDVALGRKYGYLNMDLMPELIERFGEFPKRRHEPEIITWFLQNDPRPVYFSTPPQLPRTAGIRFEPAGLLYRALRPGERPSGTDYWAEYTWRTLDPADTRGDYTADLILWEVHYARSRDAMRRGQFDRALELLQDGLDIYGREYGVLNNAGILCARYRRWDAAEAYFQEALTRPGADGAAQRNLDRLRAQRSAPPEAGEPPDAASR